MMSCIVMEICRQPPYLIFLVNHQRFEYTGRNKNSCNGILDPVLRPQDYYWKKYKYRIEYKPIKKHSSTDNLE
jgi:hypothetical protein